MKPQNKFSLVAIALACAPMVQAYDCSSLDNWNSQSVYHGGDQAQHDNHVYKARWWTQDNNPAERSGQWHEWESLGSCDVGNNASQAPSAEVNGPYNGVINKAIAFSSAGSNDSDGNIAAYQWDFGDGANSTQANPNHQYSESGSYTVSLTVVDNDNASNQSVTQANIENDEGGNNGGSNCTAPEYRAGSRYAAGDVVANYDVLYRCNIAGWCSSSGAWAYEPGVGAHWAQAWTQTSECSDGGNGTQNQAPLARISAPSTAELNANLSFTGSDSRDPDGSIATYDWRFGDGASSTSINPTHRYTGVGNYQVTLKVTDNNGATSEISHTVRIEDSSGGNNNGGSNNGGGNNNGNNGGEAGNKIIGYFAEWGVYGRDYHIKDIDTSGSADKLTHIVYAFGNVQNGECKVGDSYAAYDKFYSAADSVDGVADTWDADTLRGNFGQLRRLKAKYPNLKVVWSFGGWTWSKGFGEAAANAERFANSCYDLIYDPRWSDVFDGIDIDWEYPNECGLTCDNSGFDGYRILMKALRDRFGNKLVTAAIGAGESKINAADYGGAAQYLDFYMLMTYDFFGAFAAQGPTAPHSALYDYPGMPIQGFSSDNGIQVLKSKGVPSEKILLGIGFYGRGWTNVTQSAPGGSAGGAGQGTYEAGIDDYKVLKNTCPATGTIAGTAYAKCGNEWWSYDTPATIQGKMDYAKQQGLGGAFFWELSGDTANGELIQSIDKGLNR